MNKKGDNKQKEVIECFQTIGLLGSDFRSLRIKQIRKYARAITHAQAQKNIHKCLQILKSQSKTIEELQKVLIFDHILIQQGEQLSSDIKDMIIDNINDILNVAQSTIKKKKTDMNKSGIFSVQKTFNWIKNRISTSKEKKSIRQRRNSDFSKEKPRVSSTQGDSTPKNHTSKEEFLFYNLIVPYASFLLKIINSKTISSPSQLKNIRKEEIWKEINAFKSLMQVTNVIVLVLRYYMQQYLELIVCLIKVFDFDIKMRYPVVEGFLKNTFHELQSEHKKIIQMEVSDLKQCQLIGDLIDRFELIEIKNIIQQLAEINEGILQVYYGRYHFNRLQIEGINCVKLLKTSSEFQLIFGILKTRQKIERSKQKSLRRENLSRIQMSSSQILKKDMKNQNKSNLKLVINRNRTSKYHEQQVIEPNTPVKQPLSTPSTQGRTQQTESELCKQTRQNQIANRFKLLRQSTTNQEHHKRNKLKL